MTKIYSYNIMSEMSRVSSLKQESKKMYVDDTTITNPKACRSSEHEVGHLKKKVRFNEPSTDKAIQTKMIARGTSRVLPKIQITDVSNNVDKDELADSWMNDNSSDNSFTNNHNNTTGITMPYPIFDPESKKDKNLHIHFPKDRHLLKEEAIAKRKICKETGLRLSSSSSESEMDLDFAFDGCFKSPLSSLTSSQEKFVCENPLQIFPEETSFPSVELFPGEQLLKEYNDSVFDDPLEENE